MAEREVKGERGGANKPFGVKAKLGRPPGDPRTARPGDPLFYDGPAPVMSVIADAKLTALKFDTAVTLIVGHVRLLAQVLGLTPGSLGDIVAEAGRIFDSEESLPPAVDPTAPPG